MIIRPVPVRMRIIVWKMRATIDKGKKKGGITDSAFESNSQSPNATNVHMPL